MNLLGRLSMRSSHSSSLHELDSHHTSAILTALNYTSPSVYTIPRVLQIQWASTRVILIHAERMSRVCGSG